MIIVLKESTGASSAINLSTHSWETESVPGDDSMLTMVLDNGKKLTLSKVKYEKILARLKSEENFLVLD